MIEEWKDIQGYEGRYLDELIDSIREPEKLLKIVRKEV